ncbi:10703_t:CDS:2, partial [Ambispora leptoticha]
EVEKVNNMEDVIEIEADSSMTICDSSEEDEEERGERKVIGEKEILDLNFDDKNWMDWPVFVLDNDDRGERSSK